MTTPEQEQAAKYAAEERLFDAKEELVKVDKEKLTLEEEKLLEKAKICEEFLSVVESEVDPDWVNMGESKKNGRSHNTIYNLEFQPVNVDFMIESAVEESLVFPLIVALNEVDLMPSWLPNWSRPKFKIERAETLKRSGYTSQVFTIRTAAPLATSEFFVAATGVDDTEKNKRLVLKIDPLEEDDELFPPPVEGINRVTLGGGLCFRECPEETAEKAKKLRGKKHTEGEKFVLVNLSVVYANKKKSLKPGFLIRNMSNFVLRIITGAIWQRLVGIAEEIREGKRPDFDKAIEAKPLPCAWAKRCIEKIVA